MPKDVANMMKDLKISPEEVERMTKAFENPQFKELFFDYVKGIENPENKAKYEAEILEMEKQAGIDAKFIHPNPQECLKTKEHNSRATSYVNIATNDLVEEAKCERDEKKKGFNWSLPHSMTPPRDEMDQDGNKFKAYDVVFHPNTYRYTKVYNTKTTICYRMGESNSNFMGMLRETAIDAIRKNWDILLDKKFEILSNKNYFGALSPTILKKKIDEKKTQFQDPALRKDLEKFIEERRAKSKSKIKGTRNPETTQNGIIKPEYEIKHSKNIKMQEYVGTQQAPNRPDNLVITIKLPKLKVTKNIKLDVQDWSLTLKTENEEPRYQLSIDLPYQVYKQNLLKNID
jgi:dynein assembly factor 2